MRARVLAGIAGVGLFSVFVAMHAGAAVGATGDDTYECEPVFVPDDQGPGGIGEPEGFDCPEDTDPCESDDCYDHPETDDGGSVVTVEPCEPDTCYEVVMPTEQASSTTSTTAQSAVAQSTTTTVTAPALTGNRLPETGVGTGVTRMLGIGALSSGLAAIAAGRRRPGHRFR